MRKYLLAAVAVAAVSSPAVARDGQPYIGIEGGVLFAKDNDADVFVDYTTTQTVVTTPMVTGPADVTFEDAYGIDYKRGYDIDLIAGYDFGMFRLEGELGFKRAKLDQFEIDDGDIAALNLALNRPSGAGDPGAPGLAALSDADFDLDGSVKVRSYMLNGLLDFGDDDGLSFYAGVGFGRAKVKFLGDSDGAFAGQLIAGARYALSDNVDIGLKYRYFRTGKINLSDDAEFVDGNPDTVVVGQTTTQVTTDAALYSDVEQKFRSHSLLASLIFNFGGVDAPPPPPPYVAPPPPPPPATQTCPDGSVILATDTCPPPPEPYVPPPPPPPAEPERG